MFRRVRSFALILCACLIMVFGTGISAYALEDLGGSVGGMLDSAENDSDDIAVGEWIKNQRGMTGENLAEASKTLSPITNIIGNIIGGIIVLTFLGVFLMTALDLFYIAFPPIRNVLYNGNTGGAAGGGMPMGGMGMGGYGMRGMGGMGMGMGAMGGQQAEAPKPRQWVSDEAILCAGMRGGGQQQAGGMPMGGMGGMGMGMGAMGGQQQQPMSTRSVIGLYFKKRLFFMLLLAMCVVVLTSSAILGTGVNIALWFNKILNVFNTNLPM